MNAMKKKYDKLPESIDLPKSVVNKRGEVIVLLDDEAGASKKAIDFYGCLPDFPDRGEQGAYETRENL